MARKWVCPHCNDALIAPDRMSKDDSRRFCLSCSKDRKMVKRICPAKDREREEKRVKREEAKKRAKDKEETKRKSWDRLQDSVGWTRASAGGDYHEIIRYVTNQMRLGIRPDLIGRVSPRKVNGSRSLVHDVWLINQLPNHPLYAVYLGKMVSTGGRSMLVYRTTWGEVMDWRSKVIHRWENPLRENIFRLTNSTFATRPTKKASLDFLREGFEKWFEKNWGKVLVRVLPELQKVVTRTQGTRVEKKVPAKWLVDPLPLVWRLPQ